VEPFSLQHAVSVLPRVLVGLCRGSQKDILYELAGNSKLLYHLVTWGNGAHQTTLGLGNGKKSLVSSAYTWEKVIIRSFFMVQNFSIFSIACKFTGNCELKIIKIKDTL
jgi:hypothetical protein